MKHERAFTLVELLIVIAIIAVLVGLVFFSFRNVRAGATRLESQSALRQMIMAHGSYSADHRMELMPGYLDLNALGDLELRVLYEDGPPIFDVTLATNCDGDRCDASSYVWRMAPYLDNAWQTYLVDYRSKEIESRIEDEVSAQDDADRVYGPGTATGTQLGLSEIPAFGMNSIYVGGDTTHGGDMIKQYHPWQPDNETIAATRLSEVRNPSTLIVFAPTAEADPSLGSESPYVFFDGLEFAQGFPQIQPPMLVVGDEEDPEYENPEWSVGGGGQVVRDPMAQLDAGAGLPIARWGDDVMPVANLDGSTTMESISGLMIDMNRWRAFD